MPHATTSELEAALDHVRSSPADAGSLEMIVRRPDVGERDIVESAELDPQVGVVGDTWCQRPSARTPDGSPHPDMQLNLMNWRVVGAIAPDEATRALAGDQLYLDLDLSAANVPPGTRLQIGEAVIEVTDQPHTGCAKFTQRFGLDALRWVSSPVGRELNLRGINARVVVGGRISRGDSVTKLARG
jgi:hypothetical protein